MGHFYILQNLHTKLQRLPTPLCPLSCFILEENLRMCKFYTTRTLRHYIIISALSQRMINFKALLFFENGNHNQYCHLFSVLEHKIFVFCFLYFDGSTNSCKTTLHHNVWCNTTQNLCDTLLNHSGVGLQVMAQACQVIIVKL